MKPEHFFCSSIMFTKNLIIFVLFSLTAAHALSAPAPVQKQKNDSTARRVLSYAQFVKEMVECTGAVYRLENAELRFNRETDTAFLSGKLLASGGIDIEVDGSKKNYTPTFVKARIELQNIYFAPRQLPNITFCNFHFENGFKLYDSLLGWWEFRNCIFRPYRNISEEEAFEGTRLTGLQSVNFYRCTFLSKIHFYLSKLDYLSFQQCIVKLGGSNISETSIKNLTIDSSSFTDHTGFGQSTFTNILFNKSTFQIFSFSSTVQRELTFDKCRIDSAADFYAAQFPHKSTAIPFAQIAGKLTIDNDTAFYRARTDADFANESDYNDLISIYTDFLSLYKTRGDQESYNACYVEMKQIHTRRAGYLYRKTPALETWFDWRLNQLLEVFSDYGTNSAKGLIYIFYVIIGFAALYLMFPSEADNLSREKSFRMFDVVIGYFSTNATLVNISEHKRRRALDDLQNFRTTLEVSRKDVPAFIAWLGAPLYGLNKAYLSFSAWLVERFDIVPGRWNELSAGRKAWTGAAVGAYMLGFLAWGIVMRFVNAFALSINAFVTLGYGEIQARGVARYLAVMKARWVGFYYPFSALL